MNKKQAIGIVGLFLVLALLFIIISIQNINSNKQEIYESAIVEFENRNYTEALSIFNEIADFKDTNEYIDKTYEKMLETVKEIIKKEDYESYKLAEYFSKLRYSTKFKEELQLLEPIYKNGFENAKIERLAHTEPYVGMSEGDIPYSSWGKPTDIREDNVNISTKWYEWVKKDDLGRIVEIKSFLVKDGEIYSEPTTHQYFQ